MSCPTFAQLLSMLSPQERQILEQQKIHTPTALLMVTPDMLGESFSPEILSLLQDFILVHTSSLIRNGYDEYMMELQRQDCTTSTGDEMLDELFMGGVECGDVMEIVGASTSGKTQLCHMLAGYTCVTTPASVIYIDTCGSFSPQRMQELYHQWSTQRDRCHHHIARTLNDAMDHIQIKKCTEANQLLDELQRIRDTLDSSPSSWNASCRLLIIDSLGGILAPLMGTSGIGHGIAFSIATLMKSIAYDYDIAVVYTNYSVSDRDTSNSTSTRPALGESWTYVPHTRITLSIYDQAPVTSTCTGTMTRADVMMERPVRQMTITRAYHGCSGRSLLYEIGDDGVHTYHQTMSNGTPWQTQPSTPHAAMQQGQGQGQGQGQVTTLMQSPHMSMSPHMHIPSHR